jgi:hypothetical protein
MYDEEELRVLLTQLKSQHRKLDEKINTLSCVFVVDHIQIQHLKKEKLQLKDKINYIENELLPDIIA